MDGILNKSYQLIKTQKYSDHEIPWNLKGWSPHSISD